MQPRAVRENFARARRACYRLGVSHRSRPSRLSRALIDLALAATSALGSFALVSSPGCGTDAKGIEDCRDIEQARCDALAACGTVSDVGECQRFYHDHCLHGLPLAPPQRAEVDQCVAAIQSLGACARLDRQVKVRDCLVDTTGASLVCEALQFPEKVNACAFLTGKPVSSSGGGQGGQGGQGE